MKKAQDIVREIETLILKIATKYPELYRTLDENSITLPTSNHPHVDKEVMEDYLENLKQLLKHHLETHKKDEFKL